VDADYFVRSGDGVRKVLGPGVLIEATAGVALMVSVVRLDEGAIVPMHDHPHEQMGYLVSGRLEFTVGDRTETLGPGDLWRIPGGISHSVVAVGGPAVAVDVFHPVREDYR